MSETIVKLECLQCQKHFHGNDNKKFCSDKCKNTFHNARRKQEANEIGSIITILKTNRRIIAELLNSADTKKVSPQRLLDKGFVFRYHTHRRTNKGDGKEYWFCFDYGYLELPSGWFTLVRGYKESD